MAGGGAGLPDLTSPRLSTTVFRGLVLSAQSAQPLRQAQETQAGGRNLTAPRGGDRRNLLACSPPPVTGAT